MKRIRMLKPLATGRGIFEPGHSYEVGHDIAPATARQWVNAGIAEEDKSVDAAPEKKSDFPPVVPVKPLETEPLPGIILRKKEKPRRRSK